MACYEDSFTFFFFFAFYIASQGSILYWSLFSIYKNTSAMDVLVLWLTHKSKSHYNWWSVSHYVKVLSPFWDLWPDITFCPKVVLLITFERGPDRKNHSSAAVIVAVYGPLLRNHCCIFAYLAVIAKQQPYMLQYFFMS
jgi:hypothetical protein